MKFFWSGEQRNPLEAADELSLLLLKSYIKDLSYIYENGRNVLTALI